MLFVGVKPEAGGETWIDFEVAVSEGFATSVAVMVWLPAVWNVTEKLAPFVNCEFDGSTAWPSVLVKVTVPG
jgi:hypothetical protein